MKTVKNWLKRLFFLTVLLCFFTPAAFATPPAPVDINSYKVGDVVTAVIAVYDANSKHISCTEDGNEARAFYKRKGMADPGRTMRFSLLAKQSLPEAMQEWEITVEPYEDTSRQDDKKLAPFHRKVQGSAGKRLDVSFEYKLPPKSRLLVATVQLKDYYKKGNQVLPRYTTVEYELNVVGSFEANANPLRNKNVTTVQDSKGKRMIIEEKGTDAAVAAAGIGGSLIAGLVYWFIYRRKKK